MLDEALLRELVARVATFHITERTLLREQRAMQHALDAATAVDEALVRRYLAALQRYFGAFHREAREHLRNLDRRLESLHQVQFNLRAERAVAVKRIESTGSLLHELGVLADDPT